MNCYAVSRLQKLGSSPCEFVFVLNYDKSLFVIQARLLTAAVRSARDRRVLRHSRRGQRFWLSRAARQIGFAYAQPTSYSRNVNWHSPKESSPAHRARARGKIDLKIRRKRNTENRRLFHISGIDFCSCKNIIFVKSHLMVFWIESLIFQNWNF